MENSFVLGMGGLEECKVIVFGVLQNIFRPMDGWRGRITVGDGIFANVFKTDSREYRIYHTHSYEPSRYNETETSRDNEVY